MFEYNIMKKVRLITQSIVITEKELETTSRQDNNKRNRLKNPKQTTESPRTKVTWRFGNTISHDINYTAATSINAAQ